MGRAGEGAAVVALLRGRAGRVDRAYWAARAALPAAGRAWADRLVVLAAARREFEVERVEARPLCPPVNTEGPHRLHAALPSRTHADHCCRSRMSQPTQDALKDNGIFRGEFTLSDLTRGLRYHLAMWPHVVTRRSVNDSAIVGATGVLS